VDARVLLVPLFLAYPAVLLYRWSRRRAAFREFARTRGLRFRGTIPSDKYPPYACFSIVATAVLLHHVVEGHLNGLEIAVFDFPRRGGSKTGVILSGPWFEHAPPADPDGELSFDVQDGHLLGFRPLAEIEDLPALVASVTSQARRLGSQPSPA
jgi:hypothetical protein